MSRTDTSANRYTTSGKTDSLKTMKTQRSRSARGISAAHAILLSATLGKWLRREGRVVLLTIVLWLFWKSHPGVASCTLFWLDVIWIIRTKRLLQNSAGLVILLGVVLNAAVTEANGGVMPVVGMPPHFRAASPVWQAADMSNHLLPLADNASLQFFSVGDLVLIFGTALLLCGYAISYLQKRLRTRSSC